MSEVEVPVAWPLMADPAVVAPRLAAIHAARNYTNFGHQVQELEARYADFLGVDPSQVVSAANCTLALEGVISVSPATTWVVPDYSFPAAGLAVLQAGANLRFSDVQEEDWWIATPNSWQDDVGLIPVAPFGANIELSRWSRDHEVIIDAAASLGTVMPDLSSLPKTWAVAFSLHATKVLPAGEGGLAVFGDPARARAFRAWSNFGFAGVRESSVAGTNAKMSEIAAAYGHASLDAWPAEFQAWENSRALVDALMSEFGLMGQPFLGKGVRPYWIVRFPDRKTRDVVVQVCEEHGVGTRQWWGVCHTMAAFHGATFGPMPVTERLCATTLGLPMFRDMTEYHSGVIRKALDSALNRSAVLA